MERFIMINLVLQTTILVIWNLKFRTSDFIIHVFRFRFMALADNQIVFMMKQLITVVANQLIILSVQKIKTE